MIFGDGGAVVTIETIETGEIGSVVVTNAACSLGSLATWEADSGTPFGSLGTLIRELAETAEVLPVVRCPAGAKVESLQAARRNIGMLPEWQLLVYAAGIEAPTEIQRLAQRECRAPVEWPGAIATVRDDFAAIEFLVGSDGVASAPMVYLASGTFYARLAITWTRTSEIEVAIPLAPNVSVLRDRSYLAEWAGTTSTLEAATGTIAWIEWMENLPRPLSVDRLLRSPGRLRLLGRVGRVRVIKGI